SRKPYGCVFCPKATPPGLLLLLLLRLAHGRLAPTQRFARFLGRAAHAFFLGCRGLSGGGTFGGGTMMVRDGDNNVRRAPHIAEGPAHGGWPQALPARSLIHEAARNVQLIHVQRRSGILGLA